MNSALLEKMPALLPRATTWASQHELLILRDGIPLSAVFLGDARVVGVRSPESIRILVVDEIPLPEDPLLRAAAIEFGLITDKTEGLTLRYGIYIKRHVATQRRLIAHECKHTEQYERFGGIAEFLKPYLEECIIYGYPNGPLEQEAIQAERSIGG